MNHVRNGTRKQLEEGQGLWPATAIALPGCFASSGQYFVLFTLPEGKVFACAEGPGWLRNGKELEMVTQKLGI